MMSLVRFSIAKPRWVFLATLLLSVVAGFQFRKITTDTNPKNMLPADSEVRRTNREVEKSFGLYDDAIVVGLRDESGVLNGGLLGTIAELTAKISRLPGVAEQDVTSLANVTNVSADGETVKVGPLMERPPHTEAEVAQLRTAIAENPLFRGRLVSADLKTTAIYVPLTAAANGKTVADAIRGLLPAPRQGQRFFIAGDPVVRDTFGVEMFRAMAIFAPIAGFVMMGLAFWMFRRLSVAMVIMLTSMVITLWSLGAVIGVGYPVHIMTSMAPVFLMAIATDAIHIFNEYFYRLDESPDRASTVLSTLSAVKLPLIYTDLTTAFAFGSLALAGIIPVRIFGICVGLGTLALLIVSFTLVPAIMMVLPAGKGAGEHQVHEASSSRFLERMASAGAKHAKMTLLLAVAVLAFSGVGMSRLIVNNNQVRWFRAGSEIRVADTAFNEALGGTATANVVVTGPREDAFKTIEGLRFLDTVQTALRATPEVGATLSLGDYVKRINQVIRGGSQQEHRLPNSSEEVAQYVFLFDSSARPSDVQNVLTTDARQANILTQLKTWDVTAMRKVVGALKEANRNAPAGFSVAPAGSAYFGLVWNDEVLGDMLKGFAFGLVAVLVLLSLNFRSVKWAILSYVPLGITIALIYGVIGFIGKDFDMPIAVLSCLSLGMAVDFSIHFVGRLRQRVEETTSTAARASMGADFELPLLEALIWTASRPGRGILRNAVLFAAAFAVMLAAPLTPYVTVGAFMVAMMLISSLLTIIVLPAAIVVFQRWLFRPGRRAAAASQKTVSQAGV